MIPAPFDHITPVTLDEAIRALTSHGEEAKLLAGGHSLLPLMKLRLASPKLLIDLSKIPGLAGIRQEGDKMTVGALTTHYQIESSELLKEKCPLLPQTARVIGDVQVRNRGTIGGSLAHADPAADLAAAMLALGAELRVRGAQGERWLKAEEFFLDLMTTALSPSEILTEIRVPVLSGRCGTAYLKLPQKASGFALVGVAVWLRADGGLCADIGVGVTGLGAKPFRAVRVERHLRRKRLEPALIETASAEVTLRIEPLGDIHASAEFRAHLARLYTYRAIVEAARTAGISLTKAKGK
ncbi:MAG: xanthine dehydrogenase family protein subunit M [Deltaproteobacteria bacterium]|nr:xanthine dehydrogenase family protein subunit M [Deltaproteobacteria bacterium]